MERLGVGWLFFWHVGFLFVLVCHFALVKLLFVWSSVYFEELSLVVFSP